MADLPNNASTTAAVRGDLLTGASYSGVFETTGDSDWIKVDLIGGQTYRFYANDETAPGVSGDTFLRLYDANGLELAGDDNSASEQNSYFSFTAPTTGTYYAAVNDVDGARGQYTVDVIDARFGGAIYVDGFLEAGQAGATGGQRFTSGGPGDDVIDWTSGVNDLQTDLTADVIFGGAGNDTIYVGLDDLDRKWGYRDADNTAYGGDGDDEIHGAYQNDVLYGDNGHDRIFGGVGDDMLWGGAGNDALSGGYGRDSLSGGTGADTMAGGDLSDIYYVDNIGDVVDETLGGGWLASGIDKVYASVSFSLAESATVRGRVEDLVLFGSADLDGTGNALANRLFGNGGANTLKGVDGNDSLDGRGGNDVLVGGAGADKLTGGLGADRFVFTAVSDSTTTASGRDTILDFSHAQGDRIDLKEIDANSATVGNQAFKFLGSSAFTHHAGELRYQAVNGNLYLYGDLNGDGAADFSIKVEGLTSLQAGDFVL